MKSKFLLATIATLLLLIFPALAQGQNDEDTYSLAAIPVVKGLNFPVQAVQTPDGGWYAMERAGDLVRINPDGSRYDPVRYPDTNAWHERGALGLAIGSEEGTWYLFIQRTLEYTPGDESDDDGPRTGQLTRFTLDDQYNVIEGTETVILGTVAGNIDTPSCDDFPDGSDCIPADGRTHAPGTLQLYQDGEHLVLLASEGEAAEDTTVNGDALRSQDRNSLAGKILRMDFEGYGLPDNPFYNGDPTANISKVFAYGFRNPYTFTYYFAGDFLFVGVCDVGAQDYEEFNLAIGGENFGWPFREGPIANKGYMEVYGQKATGGYMPPTFVVNHMDQGGAIVCGHRLPEVYGEYAGKLLYGGFAWPGIHLYDIGKQSSSEVEVAFNPAMTISYNIGVDGYMYAVDIAGTISRLEFIKNIPPRQITEPTDGYLLDVFDNKNLAGSSVYTTNVDKVEFEWGETAPFELPFVDDFSIRAYYGFNAEFATDYQFTALVDDGVRIYLDDQLILDEWHDSSGLYHEVKAPVTVGFHVVRFEYYEGGVNATFKANFYPAG